MKTLKIELTLNETNLVLEALGNMPYVKVHGFIARLHQQANQQLAAGEEENSLEFPEAETP